MVVARVTIEALVKMEVMFLLCLHEGVCDVKEEDC